MRVTTTHATTQVTLEEPDLIIERNTFSNYLEDLATAAGAEVFYHHHFRRLEPHRSGTMIHFKTAQGEKSVLAHAIIGADGLTSEVARAVDIQPPPRVPILQAEIRLPDSWDPSVTQVWFNMDDTKYFYWLIPESKERGVVGLVGDGRRKTQDLLGRFLDRMGLDPLAYQGAQVAMHHPRLQPWGLVGKAPILLIGDAAGQVKVTTVGGTVSGLWGAEAAAESILTGIPYATALRPLKRELDLHWYLRLFLERLDNPGFDDLIRMLGPATLRFLGQYNRDEMAKAIWKLPLLQPRLAILGLRLLLGSTTHPTKGKTTPIREYE